MILWASVAWASGFVLVVQEEDHAFNKAIPRAQITDKDGKVANLNMVDQGAAPDKTAGDGVWTGETRDAGVGPYVILISDGGDVLRWTGSFAGAGDDPAVVSVSVARGGVIKELPADTLEFSAPSGLPVAPAPLSAEQTVSGAAPAAAASTPTTTPTTTTSSTSTAVPTATRIIAWTALVAAAAWFAGGARRMGLVAAEARPGRRPSLPGRGVVRVSGDPARLVTALAGPCRVIVVGDVPVADPPEGSIFDVGGGRVDVDTVVAMARQLERHGPPLVVVVAGALEGDLGALAAGLPRGVNAYVFAGEASMGVGEDGTLRTS